MDKTDSQKSRPQINGKHWLKPFLFMFAKLSVWIVVPVLAAVFLGKLFDEKYNTEPWLFLLSVGVAFMISMIGLVTSASKAFKDIEVNK